MEDPQFLSAIEKAYLAEVAKLDPKEEGRAQLTLHAEVLERAIYKADPRAGGIRFRKLSGSSELEARLLRALTNRLEDKR